MISSVTVVPPLPQATPAGPASASVVEDRSGAVEDVGAEPLELLAQLREPVGGGQPGPHQDPARPGRDEAPDEGGVVLRSRVDAARPRADLDLVGVPPGLGG